MLRLDEESFIRSPIAYNLLEFMSARNISYAYRSSFVEWPTCASGFPETLAAHIVMSRRTPTTLYHHCTPPNLQGLSASGWDRRVIYNNFFLGSVPFWRRTDVQQLLRFIDRTGGMYTKRWGDAIIHAAVVQTFLEEDQVLRFVAKLNPPRDTCRSNSKLITTLRCRLTISVTGATSIQRFGQTAA